jgi:hypothetical protein
MDDLLRRVARLEAENRRMKRIGVAALLLFALPVLVAAAPRRGSFFKINTLAVADPEGRIPVPPSRPWLRLTLRLRPSPVSALRHRGHPNAGGHQRRWSAADLRGWLSMHVPVLARGRAFEEGRSRARSAVTSAALERWWSFIIAAVRNTRRW